MVDVPFAPPTASTSTAPTAAPASGQTVVQVSFINVPADLSAVTKILQTSATPLVISDGKTLTLSTTLGTVSVSLPAQLNAQDRLFLSQQLSHHLRAGKPLSLIIQPGAPPTQGALVFPTLSPAPTPAQPLQPAQSQPPAQIAQAAPSILSGDIFKAIVLSEPMRDTIAPYQTPPEHATKYAPTMALNPDTEKAPVPHALKSEGTGTSPSFANSAPQDVSLHGNTRTAAPVHNVALSTPQSAKAYTAQPLIEQAATPASSIESKPAPPQNAPQTPPLPAHGPTASGKEILVKIVAVTPPSTETNAAAKPPPPALAQGQIHAIVAGKGTDNQLVIKTADTTILLKTQANIPSGTNLVIVTDSVKDLPPIPLPFAQDAQKETIATILASLDKTSPRIFQTLLADFTPQPSASLPGALLFLLSAFKQGHIRNWFGNDAINHMILSGNETTLNAITKHLRASGQPVSDPVVGEWKAYSIPIAAEQQFHSIMLYVHNDAQEHKNNAPKSSKTERLRFLIDLTLSRLGAMQIDGFIQHKKLDVVLRSEHQLPEDLRPELQAGFIKALEAVGFTGSLSFQVGRQNWVVMISPPIEGILT